MHCPRCGQPQVSTEIKFCSRCGLPLELTAEIVAHGGYLPQLAELSAEKKGLTRKKALKFSLAWFLIVTFLVTPIAGMADLDDLASAAAVLGFVGGILMMILSIVFLPKEQRRSGHPVQAPIDYATAVPNLSGNQQTKTALPPPTSEPVNAYAPPAAGSWKAPETGELVPTSVTEGTTKLLQKEEKRG